MARSVVNYYAHNTEVRLTKRQPVGVADAPATTKSRADLVRTDVFSLDKKGKLRSRGVRGDVGVHVDWIYENGAIYLGSRVIAPHTRPNGDVELREVRRSEWAGAVPKPAAEVPTPPPEEDPPSDTETGSGDADEGSPPVSITPHAEALAAEFGVDLSKVTGTGARGNITKGDVQAYIDAATSE